jgi:hypothetical protein
LTGLDNKVYKLKKNGWNIEKEEIVEMETQSLDFQLTSNFGIARHEGGVFKIYQVSSNGKISSEATTKIEIYPD